MSSTNRQHPAARSPTTRLIMVGVRFVRQVLEGDATCLCGAAPGTEHARGCLVMEALTFDPLFRREMEINSG